MNTEEAATNEKILNGLIGSGGLATGKAHVIKKRRPEVLPKKINKDEINAHKEKFFEVREKTNSDFESLLQLDDSLADSKEVILAQQHIANDPEIEKKVLELIEQGPHACDYAIYESFTSFIERLKESGSQMFQNRIIDLEDVRDRLIENIRGKKTFGDLSPGSILVVNDLSPTDMLGYADQGIAGIILNKGGVTSHAVIIAHSLEIPALVGVKTATKHIETGDTLILDGEEGQIHINPDANRLNTYRQKIEDFYKQDGIADVVLAPPVTSCGNCSFNLMANVELPEEIDSTKKYGAQGIGLLRSEGLLFSDKNWRDEVIQESFYAKFLNEVSGTITIRLFDVGGDKIFSKAEQEVNPFLGWRGIRVLLDETEILKTQLRAIYKLAQRHEDERIGILVPMLATIEELMTLKQIIEATKSELKHEGFDLQKKVRLGVMIEVPSAALLADQFAKEADFLSIGTNDLTQYTLAVDRGNERICDMYKQYHPAVWKLISDIRQSAAKHEVPLTVCGELAGNPKAALVLVALGIHTLSMTSSSIPKVKQLLINHSEKELQEIKNRVYAARTAKEIENIFNTIN